MNHSSEGFEYFPKILESKCFNDLSREELLHVLAILEGELDARTIVLKHFQNIKPVFNQVSENPHDALSRDGKYSVSDSNKEKTREKALRAIYDNQLGHLENLIDTQRNSQKKQLERYNQLEQTFYEVKEENQKLRDELEKLSSLQNKAESVYELRKMIDKLTLEVETQRFQKLRLEEEIQKVLNAANHERELCLRQRQAATFLVKEKRRLEGLVELLERDKLRREAEIVQLKNHIRDVESVNQRLNKDYASIKRLSSNIRDNFVCSKSVDCSTREVATNTPSRTTSTMQIQTEAETAANNSHPRSRTSSSSSSTTQLNYNSPSSTVRRKLPNQPTKKFTVNNQMGQRVSSSEKRTYPSSTVEGNSSQRSPNNNSPPEQHSVNGISPPPEFSFPSSPHHFHNGQSNENSYETQEIPVFLEWEGVSSPRSDVFPNRMRIGQIDLSPDDNWQMVEDLSLDVYLDWLEQIDSLLNPDLLPQHGENNSQSDTSLGLSKESVATVTLNNVHWKVGSLPSHSTNLPYSHVDRSPPSLSTSLSNNHIVIQLTDLSVTGPVYLSSVVMQTMIPMPWWQHCLAVMEHDRGVVFVGRSSTAKSYLASILIKLWEHCLLESESVLEVRIHRCDPTLELSFDLLNWLLNKGLLSTPESSPARSGVLSGYPSHHILYIDNLQCVFNQPIVAQLGSIMKSKDFPIKINVNNRSYICPHPITIVATHMASQPPATAATLLPLRWITLHGSREPLLGLIPRCIFRASTGSCISQSEDGGAVLEWISDIWIRLVNSFTKLNLLDALIGPAVLLSCPALFDPWCNPSRQAIINWLVSVWNTSIVHHIRQSLDQTSQDYTGNNNTDPASSDRVKVTESTLFVVIQQVLITGCPLSSEECERLVHQLEGGSSVHFPWKKKRLSLSNSSGATSKDSPKQSLRNSTVNLNNNNPGIRSKSPQLSGIQRVANQNIASIMTNSNSSSKIPVRIGTPPCGNSPIHQEVVSPGRRILPTLPAMKDDS